MEIITFYRSCSGFALAQNTLMKIGDRADHPNVFVLISTGFHDVGSPDPVPRGRQIKENTLAFYSMNVGNCPNSSTTCETTLDNVSTIVG